MNGSDVPGATHLTKDYSIPGWVLALVTLITPIVLGAIAWGELSARVNILEERVTRQSTFLSEESHKIDQSAERLEARLTEIEAARSARSDSFSDKLSDLGSKVSALTAQMASLNERLAHDMPGMHR